MHASTTEAARACLAYGFEELGLARIVARAHAHNAASIRVLEKIALRFEKNEPSDGVEQALYALSRDEWNAATSR